MEVPLRGNGGSVRSIPLETSAQVHEMISGVLGLDTGDCTLVASGGDSFHAVVLAAQIHEKWGVELDVLTILNSTPSQLAMQLEAAA